MYLSKIINHSDKIKLLCTECNEGEQLKMVCYGGTPYEIGETCRTCCGEFEIELSNAEYVSLLLSDDIPTHYTICDTAVS